MNRMKALLAILILCAATLGVMQYFSQTTSAFTPIVPPRVNHPHVSIQPGPVPAVCRTNAPLSISGALVQDKVFGPGSQQAAYLLTLCGGNTIEGAIAPRRDVTLVLVLDRSGSMSGDKLDEAKKAALNLIASLGQNDWFGLVTYDDRVSVDFAPARLTEENRSRLYSLVNAIGPGGSTNLGGGLAAGMELLSQDVPLGSARVVLISDGLANQGVTDPGALADMARGAVSREFSIVTVGVGDDFDETLLARIADSGAGRYYYLADSAAFSETFLSELAGARAVVAKNVAVNVPLTRGLSLSNAGGYPVTIRGGAAIFYPGNIGANERRVIPLTFTYSTDAPSVIETPGAFATYTAEGKEMMARCGTGIRLTRAATEKEALASVNRAGWEKSVITGEFGALQEKVAEDVREGKRDLALQKLRDYRQTQAAKNEVLCSPAVATHLEKDVDAMEAMVAQTFSGKAEEVEQARKQNAKEMQSMGYKKQKGY